MLEKWVIKAVGKNPYRCFRLLTALVNVRNKKGEVLYRVQWTKEVDHFELELKWGKPQHPSFYRKMSLWERVKLWWYRLRYKTVQG